MWLNEENVQVKMLREDGVLEEDEEIMG